MLPPDPQRRTVELQRRPRVPGLRLHAQPGPLRGLRQPAAPRPEPVRGGVPRPRDRHPAAVAQPVLAVRLEERGVLAHLVRQVDDLRQPQLLPLVHVRRPGQRQHQQCGRPRPRQAPEPRPVADHVVVGQHPGGRRAHGPHGVQRLVHGGPQRSRVPTGRQIVEVERLVQLVPPHVQSSTGHTRRPRLGDPDPLAGVLVQHLPPGPVDLVDPVLVEEGQHLVAQQLQLLVTPRSGSPAAFTSPCATSIRNPSTPRSSQNRSTDRKLVLHGRVFPVEVGLLGSEQMEVPLPVLDPRPRGAAEDRLPVVRRLLSRLALPRAEVEALAQRGPRTFPQRLLEPFVLVGAVVGNEVHDDPQVQRVRFADDGVGVVQGAEHGVDGPVVGDVVAGVGLRGGVEGAQPDGVDAQLLEVGQSAADALEVPHAVPVGVGEAARIDLVDHRVSPPAGPGPGRGGEGVGEVLGHGVLGEVGPVEHRNGRRVVTPWWRPPSCRRRGDAGRTGRRRPRGWR